MSGLQTGRALRDTQLAMFQLQQAEFLAECRAVAMQVARRNGQVSINDVRQAVSVPPGVHPSVLGAVFKTKQFKVVGYTQAEHPGAHARIVRVYSLKEEF